MSDYIRTIRAKIGNDLLMLPSVAAVIRDDAGRILLQEKSSGEGWSLPAGGIEPGETPQDAIRREVMEETGLRVLSTQLLAIFGGRAFRYTYPNGHRVEYLVALYLCKAEGNPSFEQGGETRHLRYFGRDEMPTLALPYPKDVLFGEPRACDFTDAYA
ncbi:MAG: NUDIX domain-containing protein [Alphaproteobacteria bacterium]|nr:NUDIX domain-containing protein [Alphaproteobacteria bacterium]